MEVDGVGEGARGGVPDRVVVGRLQNGAISEGDVDHGVFAAVPDQGGDGSGFGTAAFGVGGENLVPDPDGGDGFFLAVGHEDWGVAGEAIRAQAGLGRVAPEGSSCGVSAFCGGSSRSKTLLPGEVQSGIPLTLRHFTCGN